MAAKRTGNASPLIGQCSARRGEMRWRGSCKGFKNGGGGRGVGVYRAHFLPKNPTVKSSLPSPPPSPPPLSPSPFLPPPSPALFQPPFGRLAGHAQGRALHTTPCRPPHLPVRP